MNSTASANTASENASGSTRIVSYNAEGIALCTASISALIGQLVIGQFNKPITFKVVV